MPVCKSFLGNEGVGAVVVQGRSEDCGDVCSLRCVQVTICLDRPSQLPVGVLETGMGFKIRESGEGCAKG